MIGIHSLLQLLQPYVIKFARLPYSAIQKNIIYLILYDIKYLKLSWNHISCARRNQEWSVGGVLHVEGQKLERQYLAAKYSLMYANITCIKIAKWHEHPHLLPYVTSAQLLT